MLRSNIKIIPFAENCYIVISGEKIEASGTNGCQPCISFFYGSKTGGCEWEPKYGPITKVKPCEENDPLSSPHFFYPFFKTGFWNQSAVDTEKLPQLFLEGNYEGIFAVLKKWSE